MNLRPVALIALALPAVLFCAVTPSVAEEEGLYVGCAANLLTLQGTGTWAGRDFDITAPLPGADVDEIGLNWTEKLLFGLKPAVGYRFGSRLAVQASVTGSIPVNSVQSYSSYQGGINYTQSADIDWSQQSTEAIVKYYPRGDWHMYVYGGAQYVQISIDLLATESASQTLPDGQVVTNEESFEYGLDLDTFGGIVGAGIEFPSESMNLTAYGAIQYSWAEAESDVFLYETGDFHAKVGGFSVLFGLKMHPFQR